MSRALLAAVALLGLALVDCHPRAPAPDPQPAPAVPKTGAPAGQRTERPTKKPRLVTADSTARPVIDTVRKQVELSTSRGRQVLVYVGATWCEPCQRFHDAVLSGKLDEAFPKVDFVEFDHDRDADGLEAGGYRSRMIPLFAVPSRSGRASGRQHAGAIKGDGAVDYVVPKLRMLLEL